MRFFIFFWIIRKNIQEKEGILKNISNILNIDKKFVKKGMK